MPKPTPFTVNPFRGEDVPTRLLDIPEAAPELEPARRYFRPSIPTGDSDPRKPRRAVKIRPFTGAR